MEDFKNKQEQLDVKVELAKPEDWEVCKNLRMESITGPDARMFMATPEMVKEEENKSEEEWKKETSSDEMFSVLAWNNLEAVGLGRTKRRSEGIWNMRNGYVKPDFRNIGIQQKMLALRLREIIKRGGKGAVSGIEADNFVSIHNSEKFGFRIVEAHMDHGGWYRMEIDLTKPEVIQKINEILNAG